MNLENNPLFTEENVNAVINLDSEVSKPIVMEYGEGYTRFFALSITNIIIVMILIAFIISPIFCEEYQKSMDSLILTSKNGKTSQILAKIFTGVSIGVLVTFILLGACLLTCLVTYGFEGGLSAIQNYVALLTFNFTMLDAVVLLFITSAFGSFLIVSIGLFLSSITRSAIIPLVVSIVIASLGMFSGINFDIAEKIRFFLPASMGSFWDVVATQLSFNIFGTTVWLYQAVCIVAFSVGSLLLFFAYSNFKKHQVQWFIG